MITGVPALSNRPYHAPGKSWDCYANILTFSGNSAVLAMAGNDYSPEKTSVFIKSHEPHNLSLLSAFILFPTAPILLQCRNLFTILFLIFTSNRLECLAVVGHLPSSTQCSCLHALTYIVFLGCCIWIFYEQLV